MLSAPTAEQWNRFERLGHVCLGVLDGNVLQALQATADALMAGRYPCDYDTLLMQLDSDDGQHTSLGEQTNGFKGATRAYRKIQGLEQVGPFRDLIEAEPFREICRHVYGADTDIACFRAMLMNKPARGGTDLPWHQDRWRDLDRDPLLTVWVALDAAGAAQGCMEVIEGSHGWGLLNPGHHSGWLNAAQRRALEPHPTMPLEAQAGDVYLLHNWLLHRSGRNATGEARRAFSFCYMEAATQAHSGAAFPRVFQADTRSEAPNVP